MNAVKYLFKLAAAVAIVASSILATAVTANGATTIKGSKHDLTLQTWGTNQICIYCHASHNALSTLVPLWNHGTTVQAAYTLYGNPNGTMQAVTAQPSGTSKACLSCHDGTVANDTFGGATGSHSISGLSNLGTDLSKTHPISFTYDAALAIADKALVSPASAAKVDAAGNIPLFLGKVECGSCHAVHDSTYTPFLRMNNNGSAMCLTCHIK
ncbi:MAG: cytochrome c3 family protein [Verrucomicrobiota bacterium]